MTLTAKLAEVMAAVQHVPKRGKNVFHGYDYATEADIVTAIRQELAKRQVMLIPAITKMHREPVGEKGSVLTTLEMQFTFRDGESTEEITRPWLGAGTDKEDKGAYKAMTGGEKYFILKTFLIPTGDDPEAEIQIKGRGATPSRQPAPAAPDAVKPNGQLPPFVDTTTGEERPAPPPGYHYLTGYVFKNGWHEVTVLGLRVEGHQSPDARLSTKKPIGFVAEQASAGGFPVKVTTKPKRSGGKDGEAYLDSILAWKAPLEHEPTGADGPPPGMFPDSSF